MRYPLLATYVLSSNLFPYSNDITPINELPYTTTFHTNNSFVFTKLSETPEIETVSADMIAQTLFIDIGVGTPAQQIKILIDTGSATFWLASSACKTEACLRENRLYNYEKSSTSSGPNGSVQNLKYGDGTTVRCKVGKDSVSFGNLLIKDTPICEAFSITESRVPISGIIGFAAPVEWSIFNLGLLRDESASFSKVWSRAVSKKHQKISFWFNFNTETSNESAGEITLGGYEKSKISGDIHWYC